jgi:hypothetical protein
MKLDLYKTCKAEYATPRQPVKLGVKPAHYLALSGQSEPGGPDGIGALMNVAFTVKMTRKFARRIKGAPLDVAGEVAHDPAASCEVMWSAATCRRFPPVHLRG